MFKDTGAMKRIPLFFPCWDPFCEIQPIPPKASARRLIIKFLLAFGCTSHGFLSASGERHSTPPSCQQRQMLASFQQKKSLGSNLAVVQTAAACALNVNGACQGRMTETSLKKVLCRPSSRKS